MRHPFRIEGDAAHIDVNGFKVIVDTDALALLANAKLSVVKRRRFYYWVCVYIPVSAMPDLP